MCLICFYLSFNLIDKHTSLSIYQFVSVYVCFFLKKEYLCRSQSVSRHFLPFLTRDESKSKIDLNLNSHDADDVSGSGVLRFF